MQLALRYKVAVFWGLLSVAGVAFERASGQQMAASFHGPPGFGATVSVATLRIPEKAWKHFEKARAAAEHNRLEESARETEKALAIAPDFAAAYLLRGETAIQQGSFDAAIANVKEARRVEPDVKWAGVMLAGAYNGLHRYREARDVLQGLHGSEAEAWQAAYEGARAAVGLEDSDAALFLSALALKTAPVSFPDTRLVRTNALILAGRWTDAQTQMEIYLQSNPPEQHCSEVVAALERVKASAREEELRTVASR